MNNASIEQLSIRHALTSVAVITVLYATVLFIFSQLYVQMLA